VTDILRSLISNPLIRAQLAALLRHFLTMGGLALIAWLNSKGFNIGSTDSATLVGDLVGAGMVMAGVVAAQLDVRKVDAKISAALAAPPDTPKTVIDSLKLGSF